jgi:xylan 1,4-beta-xylosidase
MESFLRHVVKRHQLCHGPERDADGFSVLSCQGSADFLEGHVRLGISAQLKEIDRGLAMIAAVPELKRQAGDHRRIGPRWCAACQGPQLGYRNTTLYSSYTAASFARKHELAARHGVNLQGALTWAFEFEDQPYFAGFRVLASNGIDLPVMNVFRMFSRMSGQRVATKSSPRCRSNLF